VAHGEIECLPVANSSLEERGDSVKRRSLECCGETQCIHCRLGAALEQHTHTG
jgi:hypothetical protein